MPISSDKLIAALPRLRRYARILTNDVDRADEIVKETLARAEQVKQIPRSDTASLLPLFSILRSIYADRYSLGSAHESLSTVVARESSPPASAESTDSASGSNDSRAGDLLVQLWRLPVEDREVLVLVAVEGMSCEDIAAVVAVPVATVLTRLSRARKSLRWGVVETIAAPKSVG
jgi:DNA-directed RNA polymerase specialized sigma24 family protein